MDRSHKKHKKERKSRKEQNSSDSDSSALDDHKSRRKRSRKERRRGNSPSDSDSSVKNSRNSRKKSKKERKRSYTSSSSDSDSSSTDNNRGRRKDSKKEPKISSRHSSPEWEEKTPVESSTNSNAKRDDWMNLDLQTFVPTTDRKKIEKVKPNANTCIIEAPGQSDRELNPYWKDGGCGLPSTEKELAVISARVGDGGSDWYKRAMKRAEETAVAEGRSLDEVVGERWMSTDKLKSLISESKVDNRDRIRRDKDSRKHDSRQEDRSRRSYSPTNSHDRKGRSGERDDFRRNKNYDEHSRKDRPRPTFRKPGDEFNREYSRSSTKEERGWRKKEHSRLERESSPSSNSLDRVGRKGDRDDKRGKDYDDYRTERPRPTFKQPGDEFGREYSRRSNNEEKSWRKKEHSAPANQADATNIKSLEREIKKVSDPIVEGTKNTTPTDENKTVSPEILSDEQLNALGAKLVKAEILGKTELVQKLKKQIDDARAARDQAKNTTSREETIILTTTNEKGLTRPVQGPSHREPTGGRRKAKNTETHKGGQRVRYYHDDDNRDLKEMFESEKLGTGDDDKALFLKLAEKKSKYATAEDEDDAFEDLARVKESDGKLQMRQLSNAVKEESRRRKIMEGCSWCLDNTQRTKHLIVAIGETCYLCLPAEESLTPFHCLLVPIQHVSCGTILDEDVWREIHTFKSSLVAMAKAQDKDVVIFEQAVGLRRSPHMVLHCVVLDKEAGDMAPIYFKKAILDSETEWATNKKVIDLNRPDVRGCVPKGLPYFSVQFGASGGFAHVIEDEQRFPRYFAQEIIGGMLDLDHTIWKKPRKTSADAQRKKTASFIKVWKRFDCTEKGKKRNKSSTSDSSSSTSDSESSSVETS